MCFHSLMYDLLVKTLWINVLLVVAGWINVKVMHGVDVFSVGVCRYHETDEYNGTVLCTKTNWTLGQDSHMSDEGSFSLHEPSFI